MLLMQDHPSTPPYPPAATPAPTIRTRPVRVGLISPMPLTREGLTLVLERIGFTVAFEMAELAAAVVAFANDEPPEIILVDVPAEIEPGQWLEALGELRQRFRDSRIALLAERPTAAWWSVCWHTDLDGYLSKNSNATVIKRQLNLVLAGERMFPFDVLQGSTAASATVRRGNAVPGALSATDTQVLRYLLAGYANKAIATRLKITESTVKARMKSVCLKIGAVNRTQAAIWALNHGIKPDNNDL